MCSREGKNRRKAEKIKKEIVGKMANYRNGGYDKTARTWIGILAVFMALVIALAITFGVITKGFTDFSIFEGEEQQQEEQIDDSGEESGEENGGAVIDEVTEGENNDFKLMSTRIAKADYANYGVSTLAETAYTLTATVTPSEAEDKTVDWSIAWANSSSSWANGKTVTDYVTITPTSDGALKATVQNLQAFGEQIVITVRSRSNPGVSASCTVDYAKKVTDINFKLTKNGETAEDIDFSYSGYSYAIEAEPVYSSVYTLDDNITLQTQYLSLEEDYIWDLIDVLDSTYEALMGAGYIETTGKATSSFVSSLDLFDEYIVVTEGDYTFFDYLDMNGISYTFEDLFSYDGNFLTYNVTYAGTYGTYSDSVSYGLGEMDMAGFVTDVELSEDGIVF